MTDWQFRKVPINAVFIATIGLWSDTCLALQRTHALFVCPEGKICFLDMISYFLKVKHNSILVN